MEERLDRRVKKYLEKELYDYDKNLKALEELREEIIESSPRLELGMPKSPNKRSRGLNQ